MLTPRPSSPFARHTPKYAGLLAVVVALSTALPAFAADAFYMARLRDGRLALERGQPEEAATEFQIACFGLLEEPPMLAECLTFLAVANKRAGNEAGFSRAFDRLLDAEERFGAYTAANIPEETRSAFETAIKQRVPLSFLASTQGFAHLAEEPPEAPGGKKKKRRDRKKKPSEASQPEDATLIEVAEESSAGGQDVEVASPQTAGSESSATEGGVELTHTGTTPSEGALADVPQPAPETRKERRQRQRRERAERKAAERAARQQAADEARAPQVAASQSTAPAQLENRADPESSPESGARTTTDVSAVEAGGADVATPSVADLQTGQIPPAGLTAEQRAVVANARRVLVQAKTREEIATTLTELRQVADQQPGESAVQHLTARLAYRGSHWADTVTYVERGGDPERDPELLFYYAIALFETGNEVRAASTLKRALPALERNEWVDGWVAKILGTG